jgi:hypothetical protein
MGKELFQLDEMSKHCIAQYTFIPLIVLKVRGVEVPLEPPYCSLSSVDLLHHALIAEGKDRVGLITLNFLSSIKERLGDHVPLLLGGLTAIRRVVHSQGNSFEFGSW